MTNAGEADRSQLALMVENLSVARGEEIIFEHISFELKSGDGLAITGPNGCGKTTLLRAISGLLETASGSVSIAGLDEDETLRQASHFITPANAMKTALTVEENLLFWQSIGGEGWHGPVEALEKFSLARVLDARFSDLSTGQQRRVSLARLFLNRRPIWILDEPTSGLDRETEQLFADMLKQHCAAGGIVLAATHNDLGPAITRRLRFGGAGQ